MAELRLRFEVGVSRDDCLLPPLVMGTGIPRGKQIPATDGG